MALVKNMQTNSEMKKPKGVYAFGGLGGVGKTTLLLNIAEAIKENSQYEPSVCILDFNLLSPSVTYKWHNDELIRAKDDLIDLFTYISETGEVESYPLKNIINVHEPSGIHMVGVTSSEVTTFPNVSFESAQLVIESFKKNYDVVFIDLSAEYREDLALGGIDGSDKTFIITMEDLGNILNTRRYLKALQMVEENTRCKLWDKIHIVINKKNNKYYVHEDTVQKTLFNQPIFCTFSEDAHYTGSHNNGITAYKNNKLIRKEIEQAACMIYPFEKREQEVHVDMTRSKEKWVELYGSTHLKNCIALNYNCQRLYVEERSAHEFPDWNLDFDKKVQYVSRACPSPEALEIEMDVRKEKGKSLNIRVVWLKDEKREVLVIEDYLESYRLVKEVE